MSSDIKKEIIEKFKEFTGNDADNKFDADVLEESFDWLSSIMQGQDINTIVETVDPYLRVFIRGSVAEIVDEPGNLKDLDDYENLRMCINTFRNFFLNCDFTDKKDERLRLLENYRFEVDSKIDDKIDQLKSEDVYIVKEKSVNDFPVKHRLDEYIQAWRWKESTERGYFKLAKVIQPKAVEQICEKATYPFNIEKLTEILPRQKELIEREGNSIVVIVNKAFSSLGNL
jgi:hypothetical protein